MKENMIRRIHTETAHNIRELGGHALPGGVTRYGVFLRADAPSGLTESEMKSLYDYGVRTVIDFRGDREASNYPSSLDTADFSYHRLVTFDPRSLLGSGITSKVDWGAKYIEILEARREWVREVIHTLAEAEGCALFNCATGKDRTGLISALLLGIAGVYEDDITADYMISEVYLAEKYAPLLEGYLKMLPDSGVTLDDPFFKTDPRNMRAVLAWIRENGGFSAYLQSCGVTSADITKIISKFVIYEEAENV